MPGRPSSSRRRSTGGVITPRSSAISGKRAELVARGIEHRAPGPAPPAPGPRRARARGHRPVGDEAAEVIDARQVAQLRRAPQALDPPAVALTRAARASRRAGCPRAAPSRSAHRAARRRRSRAGRAPGARGGRRCGRRRTAGCRRSAARRARPRSAAARSTRARSAPGRRRRPRRRSAPSRRSRRHARPGTPRARRALTGRARVGQQARPAGERRARRVRRARAIGRAERQHLPPRLPGGGEPVDEAVGRRDPAVPPGSDVTWSRIPLERGRFTMPMPSLSLLRTLARRVARRPGRGMTPEETERLVAGEHADPHRVLGAHSGRRRNRRARVPAGRHRRCASCRSEASPSSSQLTHPAGVFEAVLPRRRTLPRYRLEVGLPRRGARGRARRVLVRALARRARPPPHQRGPPRAALGRARRASAHARRRRGHVPSRSGRPERAPVSVGRRLQRLERARPPDAVARRRRRVGAVRARGGRGARLQVRDPRRRRRRPPQGRPRRAAGRAAAEDRLGGLRAASPAGPTRSGWRAGGRSSRTRRRSRSTRCTSAPGGSTRSRATAR